MRSRAGRDAQDRSLGLQAGPILRDDKLKNGSSLLALHLARTRQLTTAHDKTFLAFLRPSCQRVEDLLVRGLCYPSLIQDWPTSTLLCQKQEKLQPNSGIMLAGYHFWESLGSSHFCLWFVIHIPHCVRRFRERCQYVESDTGVQISLCRECQGNP